MLRALKVHYYYMPCLFNVDVWEVTIFFPPIHLYVAHNFMRPFQKRLKFKISLYKKSSCHLQFTKPILALLSHHCRSDRSVSYTGNWVCDTALIGCTLGLGKPGRGRDSGGKGTRGQWGTKGVSLRATWD